MAGNKRSGNRAPRRKAPAHLKSQQRLIRLNPRKDGHQWVMDYLDAFQNAQNELPEEERRTTGDLLVDALRALEGMERVEPTVIASAHDISEIHGIVSYIMDRLESGGFVVAGASKRQKRTKSMPLSEGMQATVDHYISSGFLGSDDVDED